MTSTHRIRKKGGKDLKGEFHSVSGVTLPYLFGAVDKKRRKWDRSRRQPFSFTGHHHLGKTKNGSATAKPLQTKKCASQRERSTSTVMRLRWRKKSLSRARKGP